MSKGLVLWLWTLNSWWRLEIKVKFEFVGFKLYFVRVPNSDTQWYIPLIFIILLLYLKRSLNLLHTFLDWTQKKPAKIHRLHVKTPREVQQIRLGRRCRKPQGGSIRRQESCSSGRCRLNFHLFRKFTTLSQILYFNMQWYILCTISHRRLMS